LTIEVSEDDLRAIAKRGYEGAVTTDHDQPTTSRRKRSACFSPTLFCKFDRLDDVEAVGLFISHTIACLDRTGCAVTQRRCRPM
jgi:hypothetical protein